MDIQEYMHEEQRLPRCCSRGRARSCRGSRRVAISGSALGLHARWNGGYRIVQQQGDVNVTDPMTTYMTLYRAECLSRFCLDL